MKIRPVGADLFRADGRTDPHDEVIVAFRNFLNVPKNGGLTCLFTYCLIKHVTEGRVEGTGR